MYTWIRQLKLPPAQLHLYYLIECCVRTSQLGPSRRRYDTQLQLGHVELRKAGAAGHKSKHLNNNAVSKRPQSYRKSSLHLFGSEPASESSHWCRSSQTCLATASLIQAPAQRPRRVAGFEDRWNLGEMAKLGLMDHNLAYFRRLNQFTCAEFFKVITWLTYNLLLLAVHRHNEHQGHNLFALDALFPPKEGQKM